MPTPSLILVPARFKTGKLYTPVATTTGGTVLGASGDFNVTRATTATRVNANGYIESVASGIPRLDYYTSGGTAGCPALLVEPSGQNIITRSEALSVSGNWTQTNVLVTGSAITSPDGLASGTLIVATASSSTHFISRASTSVTSGAVITVSCFLKAHGTNTFAQLYLGDVTYSPASVFANFNLSGNGAVTTGTYTSAFIQNYGNNWYRCGLTVTAAANGSPGVYLVPILASGSSRNPTFTGDGINGVYAWGAQVETGSVATSYIPTTTAAVTRNADVISLSGAVSGCIGQTEGTLYAEVDLRLISGTRVLLDINDNDLTNRVLINIINNVIGGFVQGATIVSYTAPSAGIYKIAFAYKSANFSLFVNGVERQTSANVISFSGMNQIFLGHTFSSSFINSRIRAAALYTTRLTNAELAALTTL